ncbi:MAG: T9SS type A sorting domain-containing protein [Bacteroidales bacterium]|nr:T9SS type A sorting domain-containing protein [Bacteroidales bacterium]
MPTTPSAGAGISNLLDQTGVATGYQINLVEAWMDAYPYGASPGIYPSNVMKSYYRFCDSSPRNINLSNLDASSYDLTFFSSTWTYNSVVEIEINGTAKTLSAMNNTSNTITFGQVVPNASGTIAIAVRRAGSSVSNCVYLNALVLEHGAADKSAPIITKEPVAAPTIYPNPVGDYLLVNNILEECEVTISSIDGKHSKLVSGTGVGKIEIPMQSFARGTYVVQIIDKASGMVYKKLVIKKIIGFVTYFLLTFA